MQFAAAMRRRVANHVRDLVGEPWADELRVETQPVRFFASNCSEMFQADHRDALTIGDKLPGIRGADTNHEHDVHVNIYVKQLRAGGDGVSREDRKSTRLN